MNLKQERLAEQLYNELGLDPVVNRVLRDFPNSLPATERILDKIFGPYDIKGRAKAVAALTAVIASNALAEEYGDEVAKLGDQIISLEIERDRVRSSYENMIQKVNHLLKGDHGELERLELEKQVFVNDLKQLKSNYEELRVAIATLAMTIPYDEIREQSGQALYDILLQDPNLGDMLKAVGGKSIYLKKYLAMAAEKGAEEAKKHVLKTLLKDMKNGIEVKTEVTLYTRAAIFNGYIYRFESERLSDLLNNVPDQGGNKGNPFIELKNVHVRYMDGCIEDLPAARFQKAITCMVILEDRNAARGIGAKDGAKIFPFVPKSTAPVELHIPDHTLIGDIHCAQGERPQDIIDETSMFLSLTDVSIRALRNNTEFMVPFVAINKEQILQFKQAEISAATLKLINEYYRNLLEMRLGYSN
jgi:hypothetical protein